MTHEEKRKEIETVMKNYEPYKNEWGIRSEYYKDLGYLLSVLEQLAEAQQTIARLTAALIVERDDALTWDGIGTVRRINEALGEGAKEA